MLKDTFANRFDLNRAANFVKKKPGGIIPGAYTMSDWELDPKTPAMTVRVGQG